MSTTEWIALAGVGVTLVGVGCTALVSCASFVFLWGRQTQALQGFSKALDGLSMTLTDIHNNQVTHSNRLTALETRAGGNS